MAHEVACGPCADEEGLDERLHQQKDDNKYGCEQGCCAGSEQCNDEEDSENSLDVYLVREMQLKHAYHE